MVCVDQAGQASDWAPTVGDDEFRALLYLAEDAAAVVAQFTLRDCARLGRVVGAVGLRSAWSGFGRIRRVGNWCGRHATSVATSGQGRKAHRGWAQVGFATALGSRWHPHCVDSSDASGIPM